MQADVTYHSSLGWYYKYSGAIADDENGWLLPLKPYSEAIKFYTPNQRYSAASAKILNPLAFNNGGTYGDPSTIVYTTETILAGDKNNLCASDVILTTYAYMDIIDANANGRQSFIAGKRSTDGENWNTDKN